ncbi:hypothetical protein CR513_25569, partial [Mucuna pruriens]
MDNGSNYVMTEEWVESKVTKDLKGKKETNIILMPSLWNIVYALKAMRSIVHVLRGLDSGGPIIVDGTIGSIYPKDVVIIFDQNGKSPIVINFRGP